METDKLIARMKEVGDNFESFKKELPAIRNGNEGKWVVIYQRKVGRELFNTRIDAKKYGDDAFGIGTYSVQEIKAEEDEEFASLGTMS